MSKSTSLIAFPAIFACLTVASASNKSSDTVVSMFGGTPSRNMISDATDLPATFDPETGLNILWVADSGSQTYAGPVLAGNRIYLGTNNESRKNPKIVGDQGNVLAFNVADGRFLWQLAHAKLQAGRVNDWPLQGVCSTPYIEGDRLYYVSNRGELICADSQGFHDNQNDGPFQDEEHASSIDGDIVWKLDMINELDVFPHNLAASSPLVVGDLVFTITSNGVDEDHMTLPSPFAPSFIAVDKKTGELRWESNLPGDRVLHGQWSNPSFAVVQGRPQILFPGGDGWLYSLDPQTGDLIWKFDCNPKDSVWLLGGAGTRNNLIATAVIYKDRAYIGVGQDPEHGEGHGHLRAIDATGQGDVTDSATIWRRGGEDFDRTISSVAISDGLLYAADLKGRLFCLDADTGKHYWTYDTFAAIWGSPLVADGKVYLGDEDGDLAILKAGPTFELLAEPNLGSAVYTTPIAHDGVLYVASRSKLFAIKKLK